MFLQENLIFLRYIFEVWNKRYFVTNDSQDKKNLFLFYHQIRCCIRCSALSLGWIPDLLVVD